MLKGHLQPCETNGKLSRDLDEFQRLDLTSLFSSGRVEDRSGLCGISQLKSPPIPELPVEELRRYNIFQARFGDRDSRLEQDRNHYLRIADNLPAKIGQYIFCQGRFATVFQSKLLDYLAVFGTKNQMDTHAVVVVGPSGTGKSMTPWIVADELGIECVAYNLRQYATGHDAGSNLKEALESDLRSRSPKIVVLDELDKIKELDDKGNPIDPVPAALPVVASILDGGAQFYGRADRSITSFVVLTLNFTPNAYGHLDPHPDITSIDDYRFIHEQSFGNKCDVEANISQMFQIPYLSRFLPRLTYTDPITIDGFAQLVDREIETNFNYHFSEDMCISACATDKLRKFFLTEAVVPLFQARHTEIKINQIMGYVLGLLPPRIPPRFKDNPIQIVVDYDDRKGEIIVIGRGALEQHSRLRQFGYRVPISLDYAVVPIPDDDKLTELQFRDAVSVFGRCLAMARYGQPFNFARADRIARCKGNLIKYYPDPDSAMTVRDIYAQIFEAVAPRVMEQIIFSSSPDSRQDSYQHMSSASIASTEELNALVSKLVLKLGADLTLGPIISDSNTIAGAMTKDLGENANERIKDLVKRAEEFVLKDFMEAHPERQELIDKCVTLAHRRRVTQEEFYALVGYPYSGQREKFHNTGFIERFGSIVKVGSQTLQAAGVQLGKSMRTAAQNVDAGIAHMLDLDPESITKFIE